MHSTIARIIFRATILFNRRGFVPYRGSHARAIFRKVSLISVSLCHRHLPLPKHTPPTPACLSVRVDGWAAIDTYAELCSTFLRASAIWSCGVMMTPAG